MRENPIDLEYLQDEYETLYEEVKPAFRKVMQRELPNGDLSTLNLLFEDSINLAALSTLLENEKSKTNGFLAISATLLHAIFRIANILQKEKFSHDQDDLSHDEDTSLVNGYHFILGIYAAFASDETHIATELAKLYLKTPKTDKIHVDSIIQKYANSLANFLTQKTEQSTKSTKSLLQELNSQNVFETSFWSDQIKLFSCIQGLNEEISFEQISQSLNEYFEQNLAENVDDENWAQVLKLPLLGLIKMYEIF